MGHSSAEWPGFPVPSHVPASARRMWLWATMAPDRPVRDGFTDRGSCDPIVVAVVPLDDVVADLHLIAETGQLAGALCPLEWRAEHRCKCLLAEDRAEGATSAAQRSDQLRMGSDALRVSSLDHSFRIRAARPMQTPRLITPRRARQNALSCGSRKFLPISSLVFVQWRTSNQSSPVTGNWLS